MEQIVHIAVGTVTMRPYVFAFLTAYLVAAVTHLGWRKTLAFTVAGYLIAFASEWLSINTGIPYGWYYYIDTTSSRELWIAGVPFFDSLSYVFLAYCSYTMALLVLSPVKAWPRDLVTLETATLRRSGAALLLGASFQTFLDIIIDPVALQGRRWFLGQIYGYREAGVHYGVPLSNYAGWFVTSLALVLALQCIDARMGAQGVRPVGAANLPFRSLLGPVLYLSVIVFNITMTLLIGERLLATTGIFTFTLPLLMIAVLLWQRVNRHSPEELAAHLRDIPWSSAASDR